MLSNISSFVLAAQDIFCCAVFHYDVFGVLFG